MSPVKPLSLVLMAFMLVAVSLTSCEEDDPVTPIDSTAAYKGSFVSSAHPTSGNASVNADRTELSLTDFMSDNGPDLDIYLVADLSDVNADYINLGDIKGLDGNYTYDLPADVDFTVHKHVVVWCVDFDVNFGYATLAE